MTLKQMAQAVGVSVSTYRDWEYGRKIPASKVSLISKALSVSTVELLGEAESSRERSIGAAVSLIEEALDHLKGLHR